MPQLLGDLLDKHCLMADLLSSTLSQLMEGLLVLVLTDNHKFLQDKDHTVEVLLHLEHLSLVDMEVLLHLVHHSLEDTEEQRLLSTEMHPMPTVTTILTVNIPDNSLDHSLANNPMVLDPSNLHLEEFNNILLNLA